MSNQLLVCNGCCCGRIEKGNAKVPIETLKNAWEENGLAEHIKLRISTCLGPCSMNNVSLLKTENDRIWLGKLTEEEHYLALVEWGLDIASRGNEAEFPEILAPLQFERAENG